jgi:hypothetical protein
VSASHSHPEQDKHLLQYGKTFQIFYIFIIINHDTFVVKEIWFRIMPEKKNSSEPTNQVQDALAILSREGGATTTYKASKDSNFPNMTLHTLQLPHR